MAERKNIQSGKILKYVYHHKTSGFMTLSISANIFRNGCIANLSFLHIYAVGRFACRNQQMEKKKNKGYLVIFARGTLKTNLNTSKVKDLLI